MPTELFSRTKKSTGPIALRVSGARMVLFTAVPINPHGIQLDITVSTHPADVPDPEHPDDPPYRRHHSLTTQWLDIPVTDLQSRDSAALDGLSVDWKDDTDGIAQPPAAIYDDSYGMVDWFKLTLTHLETNRYRLLAQGRSEFDQGFALECTATLDRIVLRPEPGTTEPEAETALARLFDLTGTWHDKGGASHSWRDLIAPFAKDSE